MNKGFCKGCPDRWIDEENGRTCHSTCVRYARYNEWRVEEREKKRLATARLVTVACEKRHEEYKKRGRRK